MKHRIIHNHQIILIVPCDKLVDELYKTLSIHRSFLIDSPADSLLIREGVRDGSITLHDQNSEIPSQVKFSFDEYIIQTKRMLEDVEKAKSYRFPEFLEKYNKRMSYGQSIKEEGKFNIDITFIEQKLSDTEIVQAGTGFISFMFKTKPMQNP